MLLYIIISILQVREYLIDLSLCAAAIFSVKLMQINSIPYVEIENIGKLIGFFGACVVFLTSIIRLIKTIKDKNK
jgi:ABC-type Co2+ transport system permease subunit